MTRKSCTNFLKILVDFLFPWCYTVMEQYGLLGKYLLWTPTKGTLDVLQNKLFDIFSDASDDLYFYICDVKRDYSRWSKTAVEDFGVPEYVYNNAQVWMEHIHPDDRETYLMDVQAVFEGKKSRHECEYRAKTAKGEYVWLKCCGVMQRNEAGEAVLFGGVMMRLDTHTRYDPVTHLRTANHETDWISEFLASDRSAVIMLIGIDGFRQIVNNYGYEFGNSILFQIGQKLSALCTTQGEGCMVARFIKDEFIVFLPGHTEAQARDVFQQMKKLIQQVGVEGQNIDIRVSAGAVCFPGDGKDYDTLVAKQEHALEYAKEHDRGGFCMYSSEIEAEHSRRIQIRNALAHSINHDFQGFELYFQPIVSKNSHRMSGCETLLRWHYGTEHGIRMDETIDELEKSGYIKEVGEWVIDTCLKHIRQWQEREDTFTVSVNVSAIQFRDTEFVRRLIDKVHKNGVDPRRLVVELTESATVENVEQLAGGFQELRDAGIRVSLDDFGTENSTLTLLRDLPVDEVKIDQSFILQLAPQQRVDAAIVESTIQLCNKLGILVVVEGLETRETIDIVEHYDIASMQGFYFARPMPVNEFEDHISKKYELIN